MALDIQSAVGCEHGADCAGWRIGRQQRSGATRDGRAGCSAGSPRNWFLQVEKLSFMASAGLRILISPNRSSQAEIYFVEATTGNRGYTA